MTRPPILASAAALILAACSQEPSQPPLPAVSWLVPYTTDADIPRHEPTNLELARTETMLGKGDDDRSILKKTEFETSAQYQARGPATLATLSPPVDGRSRFVISVPAHIKSYDLATKTATVCVWDTLINQCLADAPGKERVELSLSSIGLAGRAYTSYTFLKFTNPNMKKSPVPLVVQIEPAVADSIDSSGDLKMAFVISFGPPFAEQAMTSKSAASRGESVTVYDIGARIERIVVYQPRGAVAGAVGF